MKKYLKTYRNLILTAEVDYLHGFHHLDTLALNSGIWILFYMFNYVNFHSICIFFIPEIDFSQRRAIRWGDFFFQLKEGHKFTFADWATKIYPHDKNPLASTIWNRLWNWKSLIGGRVSSVRKTKRPGEVFAFAKVPGAKKIGRENVVLIIKEPPSQGYHHFRLRMRTLKLEIVRPHGVG